ncbi:MAG: molybdopterin-dependent oxidoreductase [Ignavibacteria bacterium]|jgi:CO/xanthine dehydrogenase Mo-binding subunit|nr:molybdopterin-dependent oxidoreductase [Ignavibacteria bacterium]MCU7502308.1 molybdopterin-dependent oxidoreductase [Ignavibacteria bacterium]MCU7516648.1 molybdopterin-dependent oxidoreductase [Ignavibacteria bacterium]
MYKYVNKPAEKIDGLSLVTGEEKFTDDFTYNDMLYVAILHSGYAHAKIEELDESEALKTKGVAGVLSYKNTSSILYTTAGQGYPEPSPYDTRIFNDVMRFVGDNVCAVAAESREIAEEALKKIKVRFSLRNAVLDFEKSESSGIIIHKDDNSHAKIPVYFNPSENLASKVEASVGSFERAFETAPKKLTCTFYTQYASHCAIEPHAAVTWLDSRGRLVIQSTTQVPFHVRRIVSSVCQIPISKIRVIKPRIGGGFGGKQEVLLEPVAALFTWRTKRPAKLVYSRKEVFTSARTRHQYRTVFKAGYDTDGKITALHLDALENSGAYGSHALTVLSNAGSKTLPLLNKIENLKFTGKGVYTNLPCGGAYRGYGATEAYFGLGQIVDMVCQETGEDIVEYYKKWTIKPGETSPVFQALGEGKEGVAMTIGSSSLEECITIGARESQWYEKRKLYSHSTGYNDGRYKRGIGMSVLMQGSAIAEVDMASAYMKMNDDGSFNLLTGATDLGTGSDTILSQIASEVLDIPLSQIVVTSSDTDFTPFDKGAYASSTTYLSGQAVKKCAEGIKKQILKTGAEMLNVKLDLVELKNGFVTSKVGLSRVSFEEVCRYSFYEKNQYQIQASASHVSPKSPPPFAAHFAEIEVDSMTGIIQVLNYVAAVDCGLPINTRLAEGQAEGAIINGLAYALFEDYYFSEKGRLLNDSFGKYGVMTAADIPPVKVFLVSSYEETGPFGAKSISEININGALPSIANAFYNATGKRLFSAPFTPEKVLEALEK